jgi:hypothetical protein
MKVAPGHMYIIYDIILASDGSKKIRIADPWANGPITVKTMTPGLYDLDFSIFLDTFNRLILAKDFPDDWKGIKFDCEILSSKGAPTVMNNFWVENP